MLHPAQRLSCEQKTKKKTSDFDDKGLELHGSIDIFFSKAVMRIYLILTALLHFPPPPSLRIIKRVFLINNKCSKQPSVQLREIR